MQKYNKSDKLLINKQELIVRKAINSQKPLIPLQQPSEQDIQDFYANKLSYEENERIFTYLNSHPEALKAWFEYEKNIGPFNELVNSFSNALYFFLQATVQVFKVNNKPKLNYGIAFGVFCLITATVFFLLSPKIDTHTQIKQSYLMVLETQNYQANTINIILPWENPPKTLGFTPNSNLSDTSRAFAAGLVDGKEYIENFNINSQASINESLSQNENAYIGAKKWPQYRQLGQWNWILSTVALGMRPLQAEEFWDYQLDTIKFFKNAFIEGTPNHEYVQTHLTELSTIITQLKNQANITPRLYHKLNQKLEKARYRLAPNSDPE